MTLTCRWLVIMKANQSFPISPLLSLSKCAERKATFSFCFESKTSERPRDLLQETTKRKKWKKKRRKQRQQQKLTSLTQKATDLTMAKMALSSSFRSVDSRMEIGRTVNDANSGCWMSSVGLLWHKVAVLCRCSNGDTLSLIVGGRGRGHGDNLWTLISSSCRGNNVQTIVTHYHYENHSISLANATSFQNQ